MIRKLLILTALSLVAAPAALANSGASLPSPSQVCTQMRTTMTPAVFNTTYTTFGKCVTQQARAEAAATASANEACQKERDDTNFAAGHGGQTFNAFYGKNDNDKNAFGKCVSQKATAKLNAQVQSLVSAAKTCYAQRKSNLAGFKTQYRTFGACVSSKTHS